jgi:hypothetical protein
MGDHQTLLSMTNGNTTKTELYPKIDLKKGKAINC